MFQTIRRRFGRFIPKDKDPSAALTDGDSHEHRKHLARQFIRGRGLEVGALHQPLWVPPGVIVTYVDRMQVDDLRKHYPELADRPLVRVDVVDDGETLRMFAPASQDFIIANHFLEHTQDPIRVIQRHLELLKPGGILYMAAPDKRLTFDRKRPVTTLEHLYKDFEQGPRWSYRDHLCEYAELVDGCKGNERESRVRRLEAIGYSIHFHVWTQFDFCPF